MSSDNVHLNSLVFDILEEKYFIRDPVSAERDFNNVSPWHSGSLYA